MNTILDKMMNQLSAEDKAIFSELAIKLNQLDGDVSRLDQQDLKIISDMEKKYAEKLSSFEKEIVDFNIKDASKPSTQDFNILETAFAGYVKQLLARDLSAQFPKEEDAIKFAFQNKWIAQDLKEIKTAEEVLELYKNDIGNANQWRESTVGIDSDKSMAVGMTWFMVIFALHKEF